MTREYSITGLSDTVTIKRKSGEADITRVARPTGNRLVLHVAPSSTRMLPEARNRIPKQDEKLVLIIDKRQVVDSLIPDRSRFHRSSVDVLSVLQPHED